MLYSQVLRCVRSCCFRCAICIRLYVLRINVCFTTWIFFRKLFRIFEHRRRSQREYGSVGRTSTTDYIYQRRYSKGRFGKLVYWKSTSVERTFRSDDIRIKLFVFDVITRKNLARLPVAYTDTYTKAVYPYIIRYIRVRTLRFFFSYVISFSCLSTKREFTVGTYFLPGTPNVHYLFSIN